MTEEKTSTEENLFSENQDEETEENQEEKTSTEKSTESDELKSALAQKEHWRKKALDLEKAQELKNNNNESTDEVRQAVQSELKAERIKSAFDEAIKIPELSEAEDLDGAKYTKVKEAIEKKIGMIDGSSSETAKKDIKFIIQQELGTSPTQKDQTENSEDGVVDSGLGDTTSQPKVDEKKPDALTRPLNNYERKAVTMWAQDKNISPAEAEKQWREKKAKIEEVSTN